MDGLRRMGFTDDELALLARARHQTERLPGWTSRPLPRSTRASWARPSASCMAPEYGAAKNAVMEPIAEARRQLEQRLADNAAEPAQRAVLNDLACCTWSCGHRPGRAGAVLPAARRESPGGHRCQPQGTHRAPGRRGHRAPEGHLRNRRAGALDRAIPADRGRGRPPALGQDQPGGDCRWPAGHRAAHGDGRPTAVVADAAAGRRPWRLHLFDEADGRYHFAGGYGLEAGPTATAFAAGEGMAGQAAAERRTIRLTDPQDGNLYLGSTLNRRRRAFWWPCFAERMTPCPRCWRSPSLAR